MKISYELEPSEFEAMCTYISSLFQIYADTENKNEMTAQLLNKVVDKMDKMEKEQKAAPVVVVKPPKKSTGRPKKAAPAKAVVNNDFNEV